jgi:predicted dienelactone hydrolase
MIRRLIVVGFVAALALSCATDVTEQGDAPNSTERTRYSGLEVGPTPVGSIPDVLLHDNERNKDLQLTIDYPTRGGSHPLIVISPGFGGSHRSYVGLSSYWAGNNYVVIRVNHADRTANVNSPDDVWANATPADWRNRVRDVTFVLDSIPTLTQRFPELAGKIDATKIGVAGHGYGAHTAMLLGGARTFPGSVSYADPRVKAIVAMSPQGPSDTRGLTQESWAELRVPAMFMTGTRDQGAAPAETPEWRSEAYKLSPAGDKWLVTIEGARSGTFTGRMDDMIDTAARERMRDQNVLGGTPQTTTDRTRQPRTRAEAASLRQQELFAIARGVALSFFDTYLRGDAAGRESLEKAKDRRGVTVEHK